MTSVVDLQALTATEAAERIRAGTLTSTALVEACLARVAEHKETVRAWAHLDPGYARDQARARDAARASGAPAGALDGLPVGLKDIIDTAGMATENGTVLDAGRVPDADAFIVTRLKQAGAVVMGKTVTTELAYFAPGATRNPHAPAHTPGGSSSGSAAAVAAGMVPLAIGTQTAGSVIRPASFCGIVGYKPTFGAIPRTGLLSQSPSLDTIGVFARTVEDAALLAECLFGFDAGDPASAPAPAPPLTEVARTEPPVTPALAFVRQPAWDRAEPDTKDAFAKLAAALGEVCTETDLPAPFAEALRQRDVVNKAEMAKSFRPYESRGRARLSARMQAALDEGRRILAHDYLAAREAPGALNAALEPVFARYDAVLTPAAPGPAPRGLESTGDPVFNAIWTFCGTPAVTVPLLKAGNGLPMGVQLVGRRGDDARLLRTARWLVGHVSD